MSRAHVTTAERSSLSRTGIWLDEGDEHCVNETNPLGRCVARASKRRSACRVPARLLTVAAMLSAARVAADELGANKDARHELRVAVLGNNARCAAAARPSAAVRLLAEPARAAALLLVPTGARTFNSHCLQAGWSTSAQRRRSWARMLLFAGSDSALLRAARRLALLPRAAPHACCDEPVPGAARAFEWS